MLLIEPSLRENKSLNSYKHNSSEPKLPVVQLTETVQKKKEKKRTVDRQFYCMVATTIFPTQVRDI